MSIKILRERTRTIKLVSGDMVIDLVSGSIGVLLKRTRRIDIVEDDIFFWEVYWSKENKYFEDFGEHPTPMFLEEDGLKLSIVVGTVEWYSTIGLKYELDI
jgi:hypothetical protein|tara:strand:- start:20 stop:322 length:303 start_codon:yes stop_codon:yes gene_type:complete